MCHGNEKRPSLSTPPVSAKMRPSMDKLCPLSSSHNAFASDQSFREAILMCGMYGISSLKVQKRYGVKRVLLHDMLFDA